MASSRWRGGAFVLAAPIFLFAVCTAGPASAHSVIGGDSGLLNGLLHPFTWPLIVPQILATGLLLQQSGGTKDVRFALFFVALAIGAGLYLLVSVPVSVERIALAAGTLAGATTVLNLRLPMPAACLLVAVLGLALGFCNGDGIDKQSQPPLFVLGLVFGMSAAVFYLGAAIDRFQRPWLAIAVRAVASWVVALDLMLFGLQFSGL